MKRYITGIVLLIVLSFILFANQKEEGDSKKAKTENTTSKKTIIKKEKVSDNVRVMDRDHKLKDIDCKHCHMCEYPTVHDPCLSPCPRDESISIYHPPEEGPEVVTMDAVDGEYGAVVFSHKLHAQMSVMSGGCETCHHYNTTGPVLKCNTCHEEARVREDYTVPDLESAYHRQCITCHRQWSGDLDCNFCHAAKGQDIEKIRKKKMEYYTGLDHPEVHEPSKVIYETDYEESPIVTFFHDDHVNLYHLECSSCHHDENCMKCHDIRLKDIRTEESENRRKHIHKTFEEHHQPCSSCHEIDNDCQLCHKQNESSRFNHLDRTGFDLEKFHSNLECSDCHKKGSFKGLSSNCLTCHNYEPGTFDHTITGFKLDDMHSFFDCTSCHLNGHFCSPPKCSDCHDDKKYPKDKPGTIIK